MQKNTDNRISIKDSSKGFTLIEVLIAVTIFAISLTALMVTLGKGIADISIARNKLVANYLAVEGIELVRYSRDYNALSAGANGWLSGFEAGILNCQVSSPCGVSTLHPSDAPKPCQVANGTCLLTVDPVTGAYNYIENPPTINSIPTIFTRQIYVDPPTGQDFLVIHSLVSWKQGVIDYKVSMSETLYNI